MSKLTVKELKDMFNDFDDNDVICFDISESALENLADSYRYSPTIGFPYKDNQGYLIVEIGSEYSR